MLSGLTYWRLGHFALKYSFKISWFVLNMIVSFMWTLAPYLMVHWEAVCAILIPLASVTVYMTLPDVPNIGRSVDLPDPKEYEGLCCECRKHAIFRLSYMNTWFCGACLEKYMVLNHCVHETNPTTSHKQFQILVFGNPTMVLGLDEYPDLRHVCEFPSWFITKVTKKWFEGEVMVEYTSFDDILKLKKPRKTGIIYDTWPPHKKLRDVSVLESSP